MSERLQTIPEMQNCLQILHGDLYTFAYQKMPNGERWPEWEEIATAAAAVERALRSIAARFPAIEEAASDGDKS